MITFIRFLSYIAAGVGALLLLDNQRIISACVAMGAWLVIIIFMLLLDESSKIRREVKIIGCIFYSVFFGYLFFGTIHVKQLDVNHVAIYSPMWQKWEDGEKIDTLKLRSHVESYYSSYSEGYSDYYFLHVKDSISVYNRLNMVIRIKDNYSIINRTFYGVLVDLIKDADGQVYSLEGDLVDENWKPRIHDTTPIDNTNL